MNNIYAVGITRNDGDIIEAFCRHTLTFCRGIYIYDNNSTDNTASILRLLQQEGLAIFLCPKQPNPPGDFEEVTINNLARLAFEEQHADWVIPMCAHQFIAAHEGLSVASQLGLLQEDTEYLVASSIGLPNDGEQAFLPSACSETAPSQWDTPALSIVSSKLMQDAQLCVKDGFARLSLKDKAQQPVILDKLYTVDFPVRSSNQFVIRAVLSWLDLANEWTENNPTIRKQERELCYAYAKEYGSFTIEELRQLATLLAQARADAAQSGHFETTLKSLSDVDLSLAADKCACGDLSLRYANLALSQNGVFPHLFPRMDELMAHLGGGWVATRRGIEYQDENILVARTYLPPRNEYNAYLDTIWNNKFLTNGGIMHQKLQNELTAFFGGQHVSLLVNGHLSLETALKTWGIHGEVITTPFTFVSTTHALTLNNIKPVFCDIKADDLNMDPKCIEALITPQTTAILPVHVYGHPCAVQEIEAIAKKHNLHIIYDAAHAFGVQLDGKNISAYGDVSMFSFHATKLFHTIEGGALVYNDDRQEGLIASMRNFGYSPQGITQPGMNAKMNEFQAAMGLCMLPKVPQLINERKAITLRYRSHLAELPGIRFFVPEQNPVVRYNYAYLPILIDADKFGCSRDDVYEQLATQHIFTRKYFFPLTSDYPCYCGDYDSALTPVAKQAAEQILCLPIYNGLTLDTVDLICDALRRLGHEK